MSARSSAALDGYVGVLYERKQSESIPRWRRDPFLASIPQTRLGRVLPPAPRFQVMRALHHDVAGVRGQTRRKEWPRRHLASFARSLQAKKSNWGFCCNGNGI